MPAPVFDAIFKHVDHPPTTPVASDPQGAITWLKRHIREPLDTYFAYDASVQDIKEAARAAGFKGNASQSTLLTYMAFKSRVQGYVLKRVGPILIGEKGHKASDSIGTLHLAHFVPFENNHMAFFTIFNGDFEKYIQDFADKTSFTFDALFPNIVGGAPTPVAKNARAFIEWASENNYPPIGFYSAYPGLSVQDIKALLADRKSHAGALRDRRHTMGQSHLAIDFPIKGPANAKALTEELPPLMPDFAKTQDQLGTVHFSRFMVKGDEKLLFLSDLDGEIDDAHQTARGECRPGA